MRKMALTGIIIISSVLVLTQIYRYGYSKGLSNSRFTANTQITNEPKVNYDDIYKLMDSYLDEIEDLTLNSECDYKSIITKIDDIFEEVKNLQIQLDALEERNASIENIISTRDASISKESGSTDISNQTTENDIPQNTPSVDERENSADDTTIPSGKLFLSIEGLSEEAIYLTAKAGQINYYKVELYSENFEFELSEYTAEPKIEFFQDIQLSVPIELENGCLSEPYSGFVYIVITSELDNEIIFYLRPA